MTGSKDSPPETAPSLQAKQEAAAAIQKEKSARSRGKVSALLVGVDDEIEKLRQRMLKILLEDATPEIPVRSGQLLEDLVLNLRLANESLVIASLDATTRETKTAEAHRRQTMFLSMLAHELRNPLAPIAMSVELLGKIPETTPAIRSLLGILERQTTHLTRLVEDLMDATRISSGKIKVRKTRVLLSQLIDMATESSQPLLDAHQQRLSLDIPDQPVWILGDLVRLTQVFSNLIINASKFSADYTQISIVATQRHEQIDIAVKDQGIGILPELQPFIFDLFTQGPVGDGLMANGLGIGLSLVKSIVHLHAGTVHVVSPGVNQGCEFVVTLPLASEAPAVSNEGGDGELPSQPVPLAPPATSRQILIIDDNADINRTLSAFLEDAGHHVRCALDGVTGLRLESLYPHDVICCDIGLPGMNGYEVAHNLRGALSKVCLIAISGYDQKAQRDRAIKAGFDHYLVKPISGHELLALIDLSALHSRPG